MLTTVKYENNIGCTPVLRNISYIQTKLHDYCKTWHEMLYILTKKTSKIIVEIVAGGEKLKKKVGKGTIISSDVVVAL